MSAPFTSDTSEDQLARLRRLLVVTAFLTEKCRERDDEDHAELLGDGAELILEDAIAIVRRLEREIPVTDLKPRARGAK